MARLWFMPMKQESISKAKDIGYTVHRTACGLTSFLIKKEEFLLDCGISVLKKLVSNPIMDNNIYRC